MTANDKMPPGSKPKEFALADPSDGGAEWMRQLSTCLGASRSDVRRFATSNQIFRDLPSMQLRAFGGNARRAGAVTLVIPPLAWHDAAIADLARGHSVVATLRADGAGPVFLADWKSLGDGLRESFDIDACIADINIAIDDLGGRVDVVGLCQGGWLGLLHAARFPGKIQRLVLAGTPVDTDQRPSAMTRQVRRASPDELDAAMLAPMSASQGHESAAIFALQRDAAAFGAHDMKAIGAYEDWTRRRLELPESYAAGMTRALFAENRLAAGSMVVLGKRLSLRDVRIPVVTLCGTADQVVPQEQTIAVLGLIGTPRSRTRSMTADCGHFALFTGAATLRREWRSIAVWLTSEAPAQLRRGKSAGCGDPS